jgi:hypothetical protein
MEEDNPVKVLTLFITLMMEAVRTSETSVNFKVTTRCYIPNDSKLLPQTFWKQEKGPAEFTMDRY